MIVSKNVKYLEINLSKLHTEKNKTLLKETKDQN